MTKGPQGMDGSERPTAGANGELQLDFYRAHSNVEQRWRMTRTRLGLLLSVLVVLVVAWLGWFGIIMLNGDSMSVNEHSSMFLTCVLASLVLCPLVTLLVLQPRRSYSLKGEQQIPKRLYKLNLAEATLDVMHDDERRSFPLASIRSYNSIGGKVFRAEDRFLYIPSSPKSDPFTSLLVEHVGKQRTEQLPSAA